MSENSSSIEKNVGEVYVQNHEKRNTDVHRGLKSHHIQLLSIGGVIGTGLFVGTGTSLTRAGPLGVLVAYGIYCFLLWCVAQAAGEMSSYLPVEGAFTTHSFRFIDPAIGVAVGWVYAYSMCAFSAADVSALVNLWSYWFDESPAVWVTVTLVVVFLMNAMAVKYFGEAEFHFAIFKIFLIIGFIFFTFIVMLGGNPQHDRIGFRYWKDPGVWNEYMYPGAKGRFLAFFSVFVLAAFSVSGPEFVSMCASEAVNPRRNIPKAVRRVVWRLIIFFMLAVLCVGILVPYNDETLLEAQANGKGVSASPFVVAMIRLKIKFLPNLVNALVITSAWSCTNSMVFCAVRTLHALAKNGQAPPIFAWTTKHGVPLVTLTFVIGIASLSYMTVNTHAATVFNWFINLGSTSIMLAYITICVANLRFNAGLKAQGISRDSLPFKASLYPYSVYTGAIGISIILLFNGWAVFTKGNWAVQDFFTAYFGLMFYAVVFLFWKVWKRSSFVKAEEMDITTGLDEVEEHTNSLEFKEPHTRWERTVDWLF